jgi:hypothetical protein
MIMCFEPQSRRHSAVGAAEPLIGNSMAIVEGNWEFAAQIGSRAWILVALLRLCSRLSG